MNLQGVLESPAFFELAGAIMGDGHLKFSPEKHYYGITISGDLTEDRDYIVNLAKLITSLLGKSPVIKERVKYGVVYLELSSKELLYFLVEKCGFICNKEKRINGAPKIVLKTTDSSKLTAFIRGLFDTDGTIFFGKKGTYSTHVYPMIELKMSNYALITDAQRILRSLGFEPRVRCAGSPTDYCLYLSGTKNLSKWMSNIGFSNPKHLTKYEVWARFGECLPRTTLKERYLLLGDKTLTC